MSLVFCPNQSHNSINLTTLNPSHILLSTFPLVPAPLTSDCLLLFTPSVTLFVTCALFLTRLFIFLNFLTLRYSLLYNMILVLLMLFLLALYFCLLSLDCYFACSLLCFLLLLSLPRLPFIDFVFDDVTIAVTEHCFHSHYFTGYSTVDIERSYA